MTVFLSSMNLHSEGSEEGAASVLFMTEDVGGCCGRIGPVAATMTGDMALIKPCLSAFLPFLPARLTLGLGKHNWKEPMHAAADRSYSTGAIFFFFFRCADS